MSDPEEEISEEPLSKARYPMVANMQKLLKYEGESNAKANLDPVDIDNHVDSSAY